MEEVTVPDFPGTDTRCSQRLLDQILIRITLRRWESDGEKIANARDIFSSPFPEKCKGPAEAERNRGTGRVRRQFLPREGTKIQPVQKVTG